MLTKVPVCKAFNESNSGIFKLMLIVWGLKVLCKTIDNIGFSDHGIHFSFLG